MSIESLLEKLDGVRQTGHGKFVARCPSHNDSNPSLSITVTGLGVVLLHCFAGCATCDVLDAVDLDFADLYPPRISMDGYAYKPVRAPFDARQVLTALSAEALTIIQICRIVLDHKPLTLADYTRLTLAAHRFQAGLEKING
ncbi:hypothetical protein [Pseudoduganella violaceinigra]|uniref:hypothetical protein n=1 Tax=Pseudoduganella violaceinigra TaxID=246602 RepID=UPI00042630E7|nr:hypothetical protein [Pseudoduganella violaceinigra]